MGDNTLINRLDARKAAIFNLHLHFSLFAASIYHITSRFCQYSVTNFRFLVAIKQKAWQAPENHNSEPDLISRSWWCLRKDGSVKPIFSVLNRFLPIWRVSGFTSGFCFPVMLSREYSENKRRTQYLIVLLSADGFTWLIHFQDSSLIAL